MKAEYDFSDAKRGKFFNEGHLSNLPVYIEKEVATYFEACAKLQGIEFNQLINDALKKEMAQKPENRKL